MRESKIEETFVAELTGLGALVRKLRWGDRNGAPDRLVVFRGVVWFVELKRPGGTVEPHQRREHARLRAVGASVRVLETLDEVAAFVAEVARVGHG